MVELEKLVALLTSEEGPEQGLALVETLRDELSWEELTVRITANGHPLGYVSGLNKSDNEGFREAYRLTLGLFEPFVRGVYRWERVASRVSLVLRLLRLAPAELSVRQATELIIDGNDGVIDGAALVAAFPKLESLMLLRCELDDWDELSRLPLEELRLHSCRGFDAISEFRCKRLGLSQTNVQDGRAFGAVTHLTTRGVIAADAIGPFTSVRSIRCLGWSGCTHELLTAMASLPSVETIDVEQTAKATLRKPGPVEYATADLSPFATTPKLRVLKLRQTQIDSASLESLVGHPTLEELFVDTKWTKRLPKPIREALPLKKSRKKKSKKK